VAYAALVDTDVGHREAARTVGGNYRPAKRWRAETQPEPPTLAAVQISARFLSEDERTLIADPWREPGVSIRAIARQLGVRSPWSAGRSAVTGRLMVATVRTRPSSERWRAGPRPKIRRITVDPGLHAVVQGGLDQR
jgi:hypothetical protein